MKSLNRKEIKKRHQRHLKQLTRGFKTQAGYVTLIEQYKQENRQTQEYLAEIATAKAELIEKTSFDTDEQNLIINRISYQLDHLYALIENNPQITKQYVGNALESIE